ncbi:excalibur calcium-binding protein [Streptomyces sp. NPDC052012]|uniref:excalibur calcium-binding protein n=1 Tax=Streptomyces sp. NPDC052012 TaxID=3155051 RepID=UPI00344E1A31
MAGTAHVRELDCGDFRRQEDAQLLFEADRSDPHRLGEDAGPDDGIACEALPRHGGATSSTRRPRPGTPRPPRRSPRAPQLPRPRPPPQRTRRTRDHGRPLAATGCGGWGGRRVEHRPSDWETAVGAVFVASSAMAGGHLVRRRRS